MWSPAVVSRGRFGRALQFVCHLFVLDGYASRYGGLNQAQTAQRPAGDSLRARHGVRGRWLQKHLRSSFWNGTPIRFEFHLGSRSLDLPFTSVSVAAACAADHQRRAMIPCGLRPPQRRLCRDAVRSYSSAPTGWTTHNIHPAPTPSPWQSLLWCGFGLLLWLQFIACCGRRHSATCRKLRGVRRAWRNCYVWLRWFSRVMLDSSSAKDNLTANKGCAPRTPLLRYTRLPPTSLGTSATREPPLNRCESSAEWAERLFIAACTLGILYSSRTRASDSESTAPQDNALVLLLQLFAAWHCIRSDSTVKNQLPCNARWCPWELSQPHCSPLAS